MTQAIQTLQKWGNGIGLRLPKKLLQAAGIAPDQSMAVSLQGRSILLTPVETPLTVDDLVKGMTPEMIGGEMAWGDDLGLEVYE